MWKNKLYLPVFFSMLNSASYAWAQGMEIPNPIAAKDFPTLITQIAGAIVAIVLPISVIAIIYAGFRFVTASAQGNTGELEKAKKMLLWIIVGTAIIVGSSLLARAIINFVKTV